MLTPCPGYETLMTFSLPLQSRWTMRLRHLFCVAQSSVSQDIYQYNRNAPTRAIAVFVQTEFCVGVVPLIGNPITEFLVELSQQA